MTKKYDHVKFDWANYNCFDFTREVWLELTGIDLGARTPKKITREELMKAFALGETEVIGSLVHEIPSPVDPCIVMMQYKSNVHHLGVYKDGAVLHLSKEGEVRHDVIEHVMEDGEFSSVRFFR